MIKLLNPEMQRGIIEKRLGKVGIPSDLVDLNAEIDASLGINENWDNIVSVLPPAERQKMAEASLTKMTKKDYEAIEGQVLKDYTECIDTAEKTAIESVRNGSNADIDTFYEVPIEFVKMVAGGFENALILSGRAGMGKTFETISTLAKMGKEFEYNAGCKSPLALYKYLYDHRDNQIIVFDDTYGLMDSEQAITILMTACWSATDKRFVSWDTTSGKLDGVPAKFEFNSRLVIMMNNPDDSEKTKALISRSLNYEINFSYADTLKLMYLIAKTDTKKLKAAERKEIVDWIQANTSEATIGFDLRTQKKLESIYLYDKINWKELGKVLIWKKNTPMEVVKELILRGKSVNEQVREFVERTGDSRATYFRIKKQLGNMGSIKVAGNGVV